MVNPSPPSHPSPPGGFVSVLVLAGQRAEGGDGLEMFGEPHKAFIDIAGMPMLARVLRALAGAQMAGEPMVREIDIAAPPALHDRFQALVSATPDLPTVTISPSAGSPAATILQALKALPPGAELLVTTCDHPLLTPAMISQFYGAIERERFGAAAACVSKEVFRADYPDAKRTFIKLRDLTFSGANLFWFRAGAGDGLIAFWRRLEENRKHPLKMASEIGLMTGLRYVTGMLTKDRVLATIARKTGTRTTLIPLAFARAAIDVDKPEDVTLVRALLDQAPL